MCGIVGYIGSREAVPILINGLTRLEYRGYDSAGVAVISSRGLVIKKTDGKLSRLISKIDPSCIQGSLGIGHTRWATHGKPSTNNAHPHHVGRVVLVHNGIIENYQQLKATLSSQKNIKSETDTEIICHLIHEYLNKGFVFIEALRKVLQKIEGTYSLVVLDTQSPDKMYLAKKGSPLVIGIGQGENFVASDIPAILPYTKKIVFLENDEMAVCTADHVDYFNKNHKKINKTVRKVQWTSEMAEKGGYKHFMLKEIMEQPRAIQDTLRGRLDKKRNTIAFDQLDLFLKKYQKKSLSRFYIIACGTSWHAALAGKYYIEAIAKVPISVDTASEFRYREPFIDSQTVLLVISQSGETADTLACVQDARKRGAKVISICNVVDSSIARASHATLYTQAGPEIGVASTKAFTTQLVLLLLIALSVGQRNKKINKIYLKHAIHGLQDLPNFIHSMLSQSKQIMDIAEKYYIRRDFYFIARGIHYPIALEGALKLKEISYIHAEGYSAGEMKHGPIALIEPGTPVVALAPQDRVCTKMISNIEEVKARGASLIVIATEGDQRFEKKCDDVIYIPKTLWYLNPILVSIPLQLLAYYVADLKGADIDQPRNLAKSVTVE